MNGGRRLLMTMLLGAAISACGSVHNKVVAQPDSVEALKQVNLLPIEVTSMEQSTEALRLNEQWGAMAREELQSVLAAKSVAVASDAQPTVSCKINIKYGSRALRYVVGFGAGTGSMRVQIELRDETGRVRYATETAADLSIGAFGGDMASVARKSIRSAAKDFGSRL